MAPDDEEIPRISPHGEAEDYGPGYHFREDAEAFIVAIQESESLEALKVAWPGTVELLESFHPDQRKLIGYHYHRRLRQLTKPGRELDAAPKAHERKTMTTNRMTLASIERGKRDKPFCVLVYGPEGVGKSTFAAGAPDPCFIGEAGGTDHLDVARFPSPKKWEDVGEALSVLEGDDHGFKTAVIDTLDYIEPLSWEYLCRQHNPKKKSIEDFGYGKGYLSAMEEFRVLLGRLEGLLETRRMNVVLLAHAHVRTFRNPAGDDYDHYELRMHAKTAEILRAWPKAVLFANYRVYTNKSDNDKRIRGVSDGSRVLHCNPNPAWHAKNRYDLPDEMPLSWDEFVSRASGEAAATAEELIASIRAIVASGDEKLREGVEQAIGKAGGDTKKLEQVKDRAIGRMKGAAA